jgi:endonuclease/exonuclease/phosphatase (EEP) superfamily protein YafD
MSGPLFAFSTLAGLGLALGAAVLFGATLVGEAGALRVPLDIINHFRPLIFLAALVLVLAALLLARQRVGQVALALGLVVLVVQGRIVLPEHLRAHVALASTARPEPDRTVTLATFNMLQRHASPERLAAWVKAEGVDILVLQEVGAGGLRAVAEVSAILPHVHAPGGDVALLSRYPLSGQEAIARMVEKGVRIRPDLVAATVHLPQAAPIRVIGVHIGWPEPGRAGQPAQLAWLSGDYLAASPQDRTVLAGDFNSAPTSFQFRRLEAALPLKRATVGLMSFPTRRGVFGLHPPAPVLAIDHVFTGQAIGAARVARGPDLGSDHFPVVARLVPD